jgi:hypothetical protein
MRRRNLHAFLALIAFQAIASGARADPLPPPDGSHKVQTMRILPQAPEETRKVKTIRILPQTREERAPPTRRFESTLYQNPNLRIEPNANSHVVRTVPIRP